MKKIFSTRYTETGMNLGLLLLRLSLGGLMIRHGYRKLMTFGAKSAEFSDPFGLGHPLSMGLAIFAELFCAVLIVLGLMTRLACIPLIIAMGVAVFYSHDGKIFTDAEHAALYMAGYIALFLTGPGKISMDRVVGK